MKTRSRRSVLGAGIAAGAAVFGSLGKAATRPAATSAGLADYEIPAESALHARTFMQWPVSLDVYAPRQLRTVQREIALIANTINRFEPVVMLVGARHAAAARAQLGAGVAIWDIATDDLWCRDSGPTFVVDAA
ncbi:MAG: agmatine deiminase family protein, partial [Polymorphobacter sp.]